MKTLIFSSIALAMLATSAIAQDQATAPRAPTPSQPTLEERVAMLEGVVSQLMVAPEVSQVVCQKSEGDLNQVLAANPGARVSAPHVAVFQGTGALICVTVSKRIQQN